MIARRALPLAAALAALFLLVSCGSTTPPAATVDGTEISDADLRDELEAAAEFADANPGVVVEFERDEAGNYNADAARSLLQQRIEDVIFSEALRDLGGSVTEADREQLTGITEGIEVTPWVESFVGRQERRVAVQREVLAEAGIPWDPQEYYEQNPEQFESIVCASHILVATEEEADAALERLEAGEDFAAVAAEISLDGSAASGGDLGCVDSSGYVPPFAEATLEAEIGEVTAPVETQFGFHLIVVNERGSDISYDLVAAAVDGAWQAAAEPALQTGLLALIEDADVSVSSRYGEWDGVSVVAPA